MNSVPTIRPHLKNIEAPDLLRTKQAWLIWRYEHTEGDAKPRKVPYYTSGGKRHGVQGRLEDRQQLTTFDAAKAAAARRGFDGVGFALMPDFGITALDFDKCVTHNGVLPEVESLVANTYAEYSPSGEGVRAFILGDLGNRKSHATADAYGFETFTSKGFVTFTGNRLEITELIGNANTLAEISPEVRALCHTRFGAQASPDITADYSEPPLGIPEAKLQEALEVLDPSMSHDQWLRIGMALHHETSGEGFHLWDDWSSAGDKYPGTDILRARWDSFGRAENQGTRPITCRSLIRLANENGAYINLNDLAASDFSPLPDTPSKAANPLRFRVIPGDQFADRPAPKWIVKGVIPQAEVMVVYGDSGSGKSFFTLDIALAIARGTPWRERRVTQGRVVYIAAEGGGGVAQRLKAYRQHYSVEIPGDQFGVIHGIPSLLEKVDTADLKAAITSGGPASVIVVDTFAQTTAGGNENAAEDVGRALKHCRELHQATGALVILIHHSGKDASKGARGWSGLRAAADAEIEITRNEDQRGARVSKQKDGEDGGEFGFRLVTVPVGMDEDGDVITSCVIEDAAMPEKKEGKKGPRGTVKNIVLKAAHDNCGIGEGITRDALLKEAVSFIDLGDSGRDTRRDRARRALDDLIEMGFLCETNGFVMLPGAPD